MVNFVTAMELLGIAQPQHEPENAPSGGSLKGFRKAMGSIIPMLGEVFLPVMSFFVTQKVVKSSLDQRTEQQATDNPDQAALDSAAQEEKNSQTAMRAGMASAIGVSSVVTYWLVKSLVKDPSHFKEEPLGQLMEWVKPGSADWLIGNTAESEQSHMASKSHEGRHSR